METYEFSLESLQGLDSEASKSREIKENQRKIEGSRRKETEDKTGSKETVPEGFSSKFLAILNFQFLDAELKIESV